MTDSRLTWEKTRMPGRDNYVKGFALSATIHPGIKQKLVTISEQTSLSVNQVANEVLYTGLIQSQEMKDPAE